MMTYTMFHHTHRPGFLLGFIDFFTAGLFFLFYMPLGGLQEEIETILGHKVLPYWKAYLWGVPTAFIYTLVWMARIAEELKAEYIAQQQLAIDEGQQDDSCFLEYQPEGQFVRGH